MAVSNNNNHNNNHNRQHQQRRKRRTTAMMMHSLPSMVPSSSSSSKLLLYCCFIVLLLFSASLPSSSYPGVQGLLPLLQPTTRHYSCYHYSTSSSIRSSSTNIIQRNVLKINDETADLNISPPSTTQTPPPSSSSSTGSATMGVWRPTKNSSVNSATQQVTTQTVSGGTQTVQTSGTRTVTSQRDVMISHAAKLRQSIVRQQDELMTLERQIQCCCNSNADEDDDNNLSILILKELSPMNVASKLIGTFKASSNVLLRKINRVQKKIGKNNQKWNNVGEYAIHEIQAGLRIATTLIKSPTQIQQIVIDPQSSTLVAHLPSIVSRLDKLEIHISPILERVLNNNQHLASIEPYLDEILERFDDIEPHLEWILNNIDALAPYTGLLLKHVDALLLFANCDDLNDLEQNKQQNKQKGDGTSDVVNCCDESTTKSAYSLADQLLPYLEYYISKLDVIGPHLVLLRPHIPLLLKYDRIAKVSPHIDKLFARGYETRLTASANIDVLLYWFGWTLRIPYIPRIFFAIPFSPSIVSFLCNRLPKKFARKGKSYCRNLECAIDDNYGLSWNKLDKA